MCVCSAMAPTLQLVDRNGTFNVDGLRDLVGKIRLENCGRSYAVVAIMGPQSSGKSTLLNHLFVTSFVEMDASEGRRQTTQGVWLAKAEGLTPCTLVMDLEGTDGAERGEDDTLFERQSALFALAVSDILLINIWYSAIGLVNSAGWPLLTTIFEAMMRLSPQRKKTLMFVIRDVSRMTPIEKLELGLREEFETIWGKMLKPVKHKHTALSEFFNVHVTSLPHFEERREEFEEQVAKLRERFQNSIEREGLAGDRRDTEPGTAFSFSTEKLWHMIKENKDLHQIARRVLVATFLCDKIAKEKLQMLKSDDEWLYVEQQAQNDVVISFGKLVGDLCKTYLVVYDNEAEFLHEETKSRKRESFISQVLNVFWPSYVHQIEHHNGQALSEFKRSFDSSIKSSKHVKDFLDNVLQAALDSFDRGCEDARVAHPEWNPSKEVGSIEASRKEMSENIDSYVQKKREVIFGQLTSSSKVGLGDTVSKFTVALLGEAGKSQSSSGTWSKFRSLHRAEVAKAQSNSELAFSSHFNPTEEETKGLRESLAEEGRRAVREKVEEGKRHASRLMMDRFIQTFSCDQDNIPRKWASKEHDIRAISHDAKSSALRLLSVLAAVRLEERAEDNNGIDVDCLSALVPVPDRGRGRLHSTNSGPAETRDEALRELSTNTKWRNVSESDTLITPLEFKSVWNSFEIGTCIHIDKAMKDQKSAESASHTTFNWGMVVAGLTAVTGVVATVVGAVFSN